MAKYISDNILGKIAAYDGPKLLLILFAVYLLSIIFFPKFAPSWLNRRQAIYVFVSMALISVTSTQCPSGNVWSKFADTGPAWSRRSA